MHRKRSIPKARRQHTPQYRAMKPVKACNKTPRHSMWAYNQTKRKNLTHIPQRRKINTYFPITHYLTTSRAAIVSLKRKIRATSRSLLPKPSVKGIVGGSRRKQTNQLSALLLFNPLPIRRKPSELALYILLQCIL